MSKATRRNVSTTSLQRIWCVRRIFMAKLLSIPGLQEMRLVIMYGRWIGVIDMTRWSTITIIGTGKRQRGWVSDPFRAVAYIQCINETSTAWTLSYELGTAKTLYIQKRDHFIGLSNLYAVQRVEWDKLDRITQRVGKETESVYRHSKSKGKFLQGSRVQTDCLWLSAFTSIDLPAYAFARVNFLYYGDPEECRCSVSQWRHGDSRCTVSRMM